MWTDDPVALLFRVVWWGNSVQPPIEPRCHRVSEIPHFSPTHTYSTLFVSLVWKHISTDVNTLHSYTGSSLLFVPWDFYVADRFSLLFNSEIVFFLISCGESIPAVLKDAREPCQQYSQRTFVSVWNKFCSESSAMAVCFHRRVRANCEASGPQPERNVSRVTWRLTGFSGSRQKQTLFSCLFCERRYDSRLCLPQKSPSFPMMVAGFLIFDFFFFAAWRLTHRGCSRANQRHLTACWIFHEDVVGGNFVGSKVENLCLCWNARAKTFSSGVDFAFKVWILENVGIWSRPGK